MGDLTVRPQHPGLGPLFESVPDAVIVTNAETGRIVSWNPAASEVFGYPPHEALDMSAGKIIPGHDWAPLRTGVSRSIAADDGPRVDARAALELPAVRKEGEEIWVELTLSPAEPVPGAGADNLFVVAIARDITRRKRVQEEREENERRFRSTFDNAPIGVAIVDLDGRFLQVNRSLCEILGYPEEVLLLKTFQQITHPEDVQASMEHVRRAISDEVGSYSLEKRYLAGGGQAVWVSLSVSLVRDAEGEPLYFVDQIEDITERKMAERELARRAEELAHANAELEQFSYSVSHDLRAPLRSIDGFSQILLEDYAERLDEEGRAYLGRVRAASQHMGHLMDDLLDLSRVSRRPLRTGRVDLSALALDIVEEFKRSQPEREAEFVVERGLEAEGDARLLAVALENLLGNAWKFTAKRPAAKIEFGSFLEEETRVYYVRDDGAGFDAAYADRLFGAFQRLHNDDDFEGTGIGLATVQRVIHRHGGRLWAEGEVGKGATFYFTL